MERTVMGLEGMTIALRLVDFGQLDRAQQAYWDSSLKLSRKTLGKFHAKIMEL